MSQKSNPMLSMGVYVPIHEWLIFYGTLIGKFTRWWFQNTYFICSPLFGEDFEFDYDFSIGLVQPPATG